VPEPLEIWIGKEEHGGVPTPTRREAKPPPHWRLEAIAATERPRSLALAADGRTLAFIQDRDTSDLWTLTLEREPASESACNDQLQGRVPRRLTTGRDPMPYWEDTTPAVSPDGRTVAYADQGAVWLVPVAGGQARRLLEAGSPVWLDDDTLVVSVERDDTSRLAVVDVHDPWPRRLVREHGALDPRGEEGQAVVSPDRTHVAYTFQPRADLNRSEIRVVAIDGGETRSVSGAAGIHDRSPQWSPDGALVAYASESSGWYELHLVGADGTGARRLTNDDADFFEHRWHPDGDRLVATRGRHGRYDLVLVDAAAGTVTELAPGGAWAEPQWTHDGAIVATYEDQATPPELRLVAPGAAVETLVAPAPLTVRVAPHVVPEEISYRSFDDLEVHGYLFRPAGASPESPAPAVVYPHGGPISAYGDEWDGHAQYFVDKGYAWLAPNYRGSTGYGRDFERLLHGRIGVDDTKDCLAAADYLRTLDWVDGKRLAIFGASWGSFLALLAVTDDPEHRFRCAVCKYGDCDLFTSWSQGDRGGVLEALENLAGGPAESRAAYEAGSAVRRLENVEVPILVAHGEKDERVHPKQSEELVAELRRLGKTYEYVTYPTEAHGLLRAGPQIDFYRRLERFLDWHLL
jgi:dipeptidyl aminopeptidase/acylaminoacyl peptidase